MTIVMYTDGACRGNPGPGGWGVLLQSNGTSTTLMGAEAHTTNNRMELMGAIKGLESLTPTSVVKLYTDSQYVRQGMTEWLAGWKRRGWKNSKNEPVKNKDLWLQLDAVAALHQVSWFWVKGHSGDPGNDRVDALANEAIDALMREKAE